MPLYRSHQLWLGMPGVCVGALDTCGRPRRLAVPAGYPLRAHAARLDTLARYHPPPPAPSPCLLDAVCVP